MRRDVSACSIPQMFARSTSMTIRAPLLILAAMMLVAPGLTQNSEAAEASQASLKGKLERMGTEDQAARRRISGFLQSGDMQSSEYKSVVRELAAVDARNFAELEKIIDLYGWPDARVVGADAGNAAFLVLQHSPLDSQKRLLPLFRDAVSAGKARAADLAMLEDRILRGDGKRQRYGTQISVGTDGKPSVDPIEDPENLDARRSAVGLPPMRDYLDRAEADLGRAIDTSALALER